jgi:hypothetical protein
MGPELDGHWSRRFTADSKTLYSTLLRSTRGKCLQFKFYFTFTFQIDDNFLVVKDRRDTENTLKLRLDIDSSNNEHKTKSSRVCVNK